MRYVVSIMAALLCSLSVMAQDVVAEQAAEQTAVVAVEDNATLWERANQAYIDGDFQSAISSYSAIENRGYSSARLFYNMGNAYFKAGTIGKAILYYNRALVISPSMEDALHNLEIAEALTKDKIAVVPEFFLKRLLRNACSSVGCTAWSVISLVALGCLLIFLLVFLLGQALRVRKIGFYGSVIAALVALTTTLFALSARERIIERSEAIVMSSAISVKSSPDRAATDLFVIHEGTKVKISSQVEEWCEVTISDGKKGWTEASHLERI